MDATSREALSKVGLQICSERNISPSIFLAARGQGATSSEPAAGAFSGNSARVLASNQKFLPLSTTSLPILSDDVAAGEGALSTFTIRLLG